MTRTLLLGAGSLWLVLLMGCYSGPLGPRTSYTSVPPTQREQVKRKHHHVDQHAALAHLDEEGLGQQHARHTQGGT